MPCVCITNRRYESKAAGDSVTHCSLRSYSLFVHCTSPAYNPKSNHGQKKSTVKEVEMQSSGVQSIAQPLLDDAEQHRSAFTTERNPVSALSVSSPCVLSDRRSDDTDRHLERNRKIKLISHEINVRISKHG